MNTKRTVAALLGAAALAGSGLAASGAWAATPDATGCYLIADHPAGSIYGTGGRTGCSNPATWTVHVRKDVTGPDVEAATATGANNGTHTAYGSCSTGGHGSYFTETDSSTGNSARSGESTLC